MSDDDDVGPAAQHAGVLAMYQDDGVVPDGDAAPGGEAAKWAAEIHDAADGDNCAIATAVPMAAAEGRAMWHGRYCCNVRPCYHISRIRVFTGNIHNHEIVLILIKITHSSQTNHDYIPADSTPYYSKGDCS